MADPLRYQKTGIPQRTPRTIARAHGAKVADTPRVDGYCGVHGFPERACKTDQVDAEAEAVSSSGGREKAAETIRPFNLKG